MNKDKLYSKIISGDFGIFKAIQSVYLKRLEKNIHSEKLIINPFDYEILVLEFKYMFVTEEMNNAKLCIFGIEIVKDYSCSFGGWYFSNNYIPNCKLTCEPPAKIKLHKPSSYKQEFLDTMVEISKNVEYLNELYERK